jgi:hypothetical protein
MFIRVWWGPEADPEIALVASSAAVWTYKENIVKDVFNQPFSSGLEDCVAGAIRTKGRLAQDRHGLHLSFLAGAVLYIQSSRGGMSECRESRRLTVADFRNYYELTAAKRGWHCEGNRELYGQEGAITGYRSMGYSLTWLSANAKCNCIRQ